MLWGKIENFVEEMLKKLVEIFDGRGPKILHDTPLFTSSIQHWPRRGTNYPRPTINDSFNGVIFSLNRP